MEFVEHTDDRPEPISIVRLANWSRRSADTRRRWRAHRRRDLPRVLSDFRVEVASRKRNLSEPSVGAVIYVRVSTKEQTENLSLPTQLCACEEVLSPRVTRSSSDSTRTARAPSRPIGASFRACSRTVVEQGPRSLRERVQLTRLARDKYDHFALRSHLQSLGMPFDVPDQIGSKHRRWATTRAARSSFDCVQQHQSQICVGGRPLSVLGARWPPETTLRERHA